MTPSPSPLSSRLLDRIRPGARGAALVGGLAIAALVAAPTAAVAASVVETPSEPVAYTEQAPPVLVGENVSISGGTGFGGGYIDFAVVGGTADETLSLVSASSPSTTAGAVTVVGSAVYLGSGSGAEIIGSIDPARPGSNGNLRVAFISPFANPSFEDGPGITGWTAVESRVDLGVTSIAGFTTIDRSTYAGLNPTDSDRPLNDNDAPSSATYTVRLNTADASDGSRSLELMSTMQTIGRCDVVHGPAVYSDPFEAATNDKIYFDWRAYAGGDNFHVFGYILNTVTGAQTTVLDATGGNADAPAFQTKETTIPATGTYRFVFVGGTHDLTCGRAAGARLLIDNVRVYGTKVTDAVVTEIGRKLQYANASDDPAATRTVRITAADNGGTTTSTGDATIAITPVDDAPTFAPVAPITLTNNEGPDTYANTVRTLSVTDPDTHTISHRIVGDSPSPATIGGQTYTHALTGTYGTLHIDENSGRYVFVPDADAADARLTNDSEEFVFEITAPDESPGSTEPAKTARQTLEVTLDVPAGPPSAPASTDAAAGTHSAVVTWSAPTWTSGSPVTGYRVEQSADGGDTWTDTVADTGSTATTLTVSGLTPGESVQFRVSAINANGVGAAGPLSSAVVPYAIPGAPGTTTALPGDRSAELTWDAPDDNGGSPVTGYRIEQSTDGGNTWTVAVADTGTTATTRTITGLTNGETTSFRVTAINAAGAGATGPEAQTTPRTLPGAPRTTVASPADRTVELSWTTPADDGGSPVTGYRIEQSTDGGNTWTEAVADTGTTATTRTITGLANGTSVTFRVAAINAAGVGVAGPDAQTTPRTLPAAPPTTSVAPADRGVELRWSIPADNGGSPVTGYRIEQSTDGGNTWTVAVADTGSAETNRTISGLTNGEATTFRVAAINAAGVGPAGPDAQTTPRTTPAAPRSATAVAADRSVELSWTAPTDDGGSPVTGYRIEQSTDGGATWRTIVADTATTDTAYTVSGLANGEPVAFRVTPINAAGLGTTGAEAEATPRTTPTAPVIQRTLSSNHTLTVLFDAPSEDGGAAATAYEYSLDGGVTWVTVSATTSPLTITGLDNGTSYDVQVRAVNAAGGGEIARITATPALAPVAFVDADGDVGLPMQSPGNAAATLGGTGVPVERSSQGARTVITGDGFEMSAQSLDADGNTVALRDGALHVVRNGSLQLTGSGYLPGSVVDLWLLGSDVLLGQVTVAADGTFTTTVRIPAGIPLGVDTIQVNGLGESGQVLSIALGLTVVVPSALATTGGAPALAAVGLGALLLASGGVLVLVRRRGEARARS